MKYIIDNPGIVRDLLLRHLQITAISLAIALAIALPLGLLVNRYRWLAVPVVGTLGILYTIPSLALIILLIPAFGLGAKSVIIALIIYAQIILVRNILVGLQSVSPAMLEAARGMGMNLWQIWWRVQFPLALPIMLAGLRIAAVVVIGIATIGAKFSAGGLGRLLFDGISLDRSDKIWAGAITVSALAFAVNGLLLLLERLCDPTRRARMDRRQRAARDVNESLTPIPG
ncbi:MAG: ABC transporter permease [Thermomicrobiales bacterium]